MTISTPIRAARGTQLSTHGWQQEAALRMLCNNLDPEVAERPEDLVVYGGTGKAHAVIREKVPTLDHDRVLEPEIQAAIELVRSGRLATIGASATISPPPRAGEGRVGAH